MILNSWAARSATIHTKFLKTEILDITFISKIDKERSEGRSQEKSEEKSEERNH